MSTITAQYGIKGKVPPGRTVVFSNAVEIPYQGKCADTYYIPLKLTWNSKDGEQTDYLEYGIYIDTEENMKIYIGGSNENIKREIKYINQGTSKANLVKNPGVNWFFEATNSDIPIETGVWINFYIRLYGIDAENCYFAFYVEIEREATRNTKWYHVFTFKLTSPDVSMDIRLPFYAYLKPPDEDNYPEGDPKLKATKSMCLKNFNFFNVDEQKKLDVHHFDGAKVNATVYKKHTKFGWNCEEHTEYIKLIASPDEKSDKTDKILKFQNKIVFVKTNKKVSDIDFEITTCTADYAVLNIKSRIPIFYRKVAVNSTVLFEETSPIYNKEGPYSISYNHRQVRPGDLITITLGNAWNYQSTQTCKVE